MKIFCLKLKYFSVCVCWVLVGIQAAHAEPRGWAPNTAEGTVKRLYHDYAWVALNHELGNTDLEQQPIQELEKYFDSSLGELIKKDSDCIKRTHDSCKLDFKIIFNSQDPAAFELEIFPINANNEVKVKFKYPSNHEVVNLSYKMLNTPKGWRIHDVVYENEHASLREILN